MPRSTINRKKSRARQKLVNGNQPLARNCSHIPYHQFSDGYQCSNYHTKVKVKVVPYTFVRRGVPVREDTYPEPSACGEGWPVPFLAAFISPVLPPGTHLLLGKQ